MQKKVTFERQHAAFSWQRSAANVEHSVNGSPASLASRLIIEQYNKRNKTTNVYYEVQYSLGEWRNCKFTLLHFGRLHQERDVESFS